MSTSSDNNVIVKEACCPIIYRMCNKVATCADFIHIKTEVIETEVVVRIIDKFNRVYYFDSETDAQGFAVIDTTELPQGLLNEFAGVFKVSIILNGTLIKFIDSEGSEYDSIAFECSYFLPRQTNTYIDIS